MSMQLKKLTWTGSKNNPVPKSSKMTTSQASDSKWHTARQKTTATVILKYDKADQIFPERLIVKKNVTELFSVLHNMRHSSIVLNTKQSLFHFS